jgi:3-oxoadipate enol-lactonase
VEKLVTESSEVAYAVSGNPQGPRVVLIHGLFLNSDCWENQLPVLEKEYCVLRFDLYGHGRSTKPGKRFTVRNYVKEMARLLDHLRWTEVLAMIGHSLGGMVALVYALDNPLRVKKLVIASSYCFVSNEAVTDVMSRVSGNPLDKFAVGIAKRGLVPYDEATAKKIAAMVVDHMSRDDALLATAASAGFNICQELRGLRIPTLLLVGEKDITTPVWASEMLHEWLPDSTIKTLKGAGHLLIYDHPAEFNSLVLEFLR